MSPDCNPNGMIGEAMSAEMYSDLWLVFGMACLGAAALGTIRWLWLTRPASEFDDSGPADCEAGSR